MSARINVESKRKLLLMFNVYFNVSEIVLNLLFLCSSPNYEADAVVSHVTDGKIKKVYKPVAGLAGILCCRLEFKSISN